MVYGRRGKGKSNYVEASNVGEQNNEMNDEGTSNNCKRVPFPNETVYVGYGSTFFTKKIHEMVHPDDVNLKSIVVEITEQLKNLQDYIDKNILL